MTVFFQMVFFICASHLFTAFAFSQSISEVVVDQNFNTEFEDFCFDLFSKEFGYTLVGIKPISTDELSKRYCNETTEKCFIALKKMFDKSPNFVFKVFSSGPFRYVELINKKSLKTLVQQNSVVRSFMQKTFFSEENFYLNIKSQDQSIHQILRLDERVIGYCLGYDKTNIEYYLRRIELGTYLQKYPLVRYHPLPGGKYSDCSSVFRNLSLRYKALKPSKGFDSLEAEWQWMKRVEWDLEKESIPEPPYFVYLPLYLCRHGDESYLARERFTMASRQVAKLFYNRKPSEVIADLASAGS